MYVVAPNQMIPCAPAKKMCFYVLVQLTNLMAVFDQDEYRTRFALAIPASLTRMRRDLPMDKSCR